MPRPKIPTVERGHGGLNALDFAHLLEWLGGSASRMPVMTSWILPEGTNSKQIAIVKTARADLPQLLVSV